MKTVLLIESDLRVSRRLETALRGLSCEVVAAPHGAAGLVLARECSPDLVLCAEWMPGMDGYHVARLLNEQAGLSGAPARFVLLTAVEASAFASGIIEGIDGALSLALSDAELASRVGLLLGGSPARREVQPVPLVPLGSLTPPAGQGIGTAAGLLADLEGATGQLLGLVDKFLRFTEIKQAALRRTRIGSAEPAPGVVHSNQVASLAAVAARKGDRSADLGCHVDKGFLPLELGELEIVVGELVENACKYSRPGDPVDVFYFRQGAGSELVVRDYGSGMAAALADARGSSAACASVPEASGGMGLAMVRLVVEGRGGKLFLHSVPGIGTTARVIVPDAPSPRTDPRRGQGRAADFGVPPFEEESGGLP